MPSTGFYLFLPNNRSECQSSKTKCQCPQRASTYFFWTMPSSHIYSEICVNALNGLLLISSTCTKLMSWHSKTVSMPSTGFYLFLPLAGNVSSRSRSCVNALNGLLLISSGALNNADDAVDVSMPSTGFYLFLQPSDCDYNTERYCVNALNGLLLISSVPSQNP